MSAVAQDLKYAVRVLRRSPGTTLVVLLTLTVGIGLNTAIFSVVNAILLTPLPYPHADRLVGVWERRPSGARNSMTALNYRDYAQQSTVFEQIAATTGCCGSPILGGDEPLPLDALRVSANYFDILGIPAALGRTFAAGEDQPGRDRVVVLSHRIWAARFGADRSLVGRTISLDNELYTVIGVMPEHSVFDRTYVKAWLPLVFGRERTNRASHWLLSLNGGALGLLKPGVTIEQARAELDTIGARLSAEYPETNQGWGAIVDPYASFAIGPDLRRSLYLLLGAVALVLLIGCVNVANVMLARALTREREVAVKLAIGATRGRLMRQFLTESLLISTAGGVLGIAAGYGTLVFLRATLAALPLNLSLLPIWVPAEASIELDTRVLLFAIALSLACGVAFGLAPAIGGLRGPAAAHAAGRRASATATHRQARSVLVVAEVALALVLLTNAGLLVRSFVRMRTTDTGFDETRVLTAELPVRTNRFADGAQLRAFVREIVERVEAVPGVTSAAFTDGMPMQGPPSGVFTQRADMPLLPRVQRPVIDLRLVSPSYFRTLGLRLRRGRFLSDLDRSDAPLAAVINETTARALFPNEDAVGGHLVMDAPGFGSIYSGDAATFTIVGVVEDEHMWPLDDRRPRSALYVSLDQDPRGFAGIVVRTSVDPARVERALRGAIASVDKEQAVTEVKTIAQLEAESMTPERLRSVLLSVFAGIALTLSAIGIYGVMAQAVVQRTQEIGIRAALGASPASLIRMVVARGLLLTAAGLVVGYAAALGSARLLASFLFGVSAADAITTLASVSILAGTAALACYLPARHAASVDPLDTLRAE